MTKTTANQRIKILIDHIYGSRRGAQAAFGKAIFLKSSSLSNILSGSNNPDDRTLRVISQTSFPELNGSTVSYNWLKTGEGEMLLKPDQETSLPNTVNISADEAYRNWLKEIEEHRADSKERRALSEALIELSKAHAEFILKLTPILEKAKITVN